MQKRELLAAQGLVQAELVLKNARFINVFTERIEHGDIAVSNGKIVGIGQYEGATEVDCTGKYVSPGFLDGHIHLESSMMKPVEFAKAVLQHGTTAVITDPHEIANVCGVDGIRYMLEASKDLPLDVYVALPSCVPATDMDENGFELNAEVLKQFYSDERVLGLAEVMDYMGLINGNDDLHMKIADASDNHKRVDGHAPGLNGKALCAYIAAGVESDHECISLEEAEEKLRLGQWIMIREGTAAKNLEALIGLFQKPYYQRSMLVTDDRHPNELLEEGHINAIIRKAIKLGADPCIAIKMATLNTASYFGLRDLGAVAPGFQADLIILSDLKEVTVEQVWKKGQLVYKKGQMLKCKEPKISNHILEKVQHSVHCDSVLPEDFELSASHLNKEDKSFRVIQFMKGEITTKELLVPVSNGKPQINTEQDILKIAVVERHHNTHHIGLGFVNGYGMKKGAIASSVSHDSHNIIVVGVNDQDMATAVNCIQNMGGGWAIALDGSVIGSLPLPIGGLMSHLDATTLASKIDEMKAIARTLGVTEEIDPFMTLAFVSLPVIPEIRLTTTGLFHVSKQEKVPILFHE